MARRHRELVRAPLLGQDAVEQHLLLDVLLGGAVGEQGHDAAIVGQGVEVEVLRHRHHVAVALVA